jgi:hypothetical protein
METIEKAVSTLQFTNRMLLEFKVKLKYYHDAKVPTSRCGVIGSKESKLILIGQYSFS